MEEREIALALIIVISLIFLVAVTQQPNIVEGSQKIISVSSINGLTGIVSLVNNDTNIPITNGINHITLALNNVLNTATIWTFQIGASNILSINSTGLTLLGHKIYYTQSSCQTHQYVTGISTTLFSICKQPSLTDLLDYTQPITVKSDTSSSVTQGTIVQSKGCQATSGTTNTCQFTSSNVVALNTLVVCEGSVSNIGFSDPTDTFLNTYVSIISTTNTATSKCWETGSISGGSDTVTFVTTNPSVNTGFCMWELNGVMILNTLHATGGATSTSQATSSLVFFNHPVFLDIVASTASQGTFTHGTNFVTLSTGNADINCQTSISGLTTPTTFPSTTQNSVTYANIGVAVQAESNLPTLTLQANTNYIFTAQISETQASSSSMQFGIHTIPTGAHLTTICQMSLGASATGYINSCLGFDSIDTPISSNSITATNGFVTIYGQINMGSTPGTLSVDFCNNAQVGTSTIRRGSSVSLIVSQ